MQDQTVEAARRAHETAIKALEVASDKNELFYICVGAGLGLVCSLCLWVLEKWHKKKEEKKQLGSLLYLFAFDAVDLLKTTARYSESIANAVGGIPFSTGYDMVPPNEVSRLVSLGCSEGIIEAIFKVRERTSSIVSLVARLAEAGRFDVEQTAEGIENNHTLEAKHDLMKSIHKYYDEGVGAARAIIAGIQSVELLMRRNNLTRTLEKAEEDYRAARRAYEARYPERVGNQR